MMQCQGDLELTIPPLDGITLFEIEIHKERYASVGYIAGRVGQDADGDAVLGINGDFAAVPVDVSAMVDQRVIGKLEDAPAQAVIVVLDPADLAVGTVA